MAQAQGGCEADGEVGVATIVTTSLPMTAGCSETKPSVSVMCGAGRRLTRGVDVDDRVGGQRESADIACANASNKARHVVQRVAEVEGEAVGETRAGRGQRMS